MPKPYKKGKSSQTTSEASPSTAWKTQEATRNSSREPFKYDKLSSKRDSIRVVVVLPDLSPEGFMQCDLQHTTIYADFTCLSYVWGRRTKLYTILLNGKTFFVRRGLLEFLEVARDKYHSKRLWIDAICINQNDDSEKSYQIPRMGNIYWEATQVLSWLGNNKYTSWFLKLVRENPQFKDLWTCYYLDRYHTSPKVYIDGSQSSLSSLALHFYDNEYWKRAWITQEVAMARKLILVSGREELDFAEVKERLDLKGDFPNQQLRGMRLQDLLEKFDRKKCANVVDRIYSLASLSHEKITVDYTLSREEVFDQTMKSCKDSLCFCTVHCIQRALELDPARLPTSRFAEFRLQQVSDDDWRKTPYPSDLNGIYLDFASFCRSFRGHLLCQASAIRNRITEAYVSRDGLEFEYLGSDTSVEQVGETSFYDVRVSLRTLVRMLLLPQMSYKSRYEASHGQLLRLCDNLGSTSFSGQRGHMDLKEWVTIRLSWERRMRKRLLDFMIKIRMLYYDGIDFEFEPPQDLVDFVSRNE
ncbi:heterokaryon incompatibility protein-domain-containing protein [Lophiotrema nucula]|uniref:Heterokaryon incompatibility protein-domain-containing protein n=1 Tax=Lophiotrema nucula TaxID=690887 RepID=A0A6A5Z0X5_9PLEO|nr:heterokaryon incompatibility protein-domain-containing protein [Lophiotrema nucula]